LKALIILPTRGNTKYLPISSMHFEQSLKKD